MKTDKGNFLERLKSGETFYMNVSGKKKGQPRQGVSLGHDAHYKDLMMAVGGVAFTHGYKNVQVSFSRNIMADADGVVVFRVKQSITVKEERTY